MDPKSSCSCTDPIKTNPTNSSIKRGGGGGGGGVNCGVLFFNNQACLDFRRGVSMLPSSASSSSSSLSSTSAGASTSTISPEELAEIQSFLDRRSRHVLKTIVSPCGVVYDCVPYNKHPTFENSPPIMDYKIPDISKFGIVRSVSDTSTTDTPRVCLQCPEGTMPIRRMTLEDMLRIRSCRKTWCPPMISQNPPDSK